MRCIRTATAELKQSDCHWRRANVYAWATNAFYMGHTAHKKTARLWCAPMSCALAVPARGLKPARSHADWCRCLLGTFRTVVMKCKSGNG